MGRNGILESESFSLNSGLLFASSIVRTPPRHEVRRHLPALALRPTNAKALSEEKSSKFDRRPAIGIVTADWACGHPGGSVAKGMTKISYSGYRFPPEIIQQAIWLYVRFTLSFRDVEDLLAERGMVVS